MKSDNFSLQHISYIIYSSVHLLLQWACMIQWYISVYDMMEDM